MCLSKRHELAIMGFFGILSVYFLRANLSVAIIAMVDENYKRNTTSISNNSSSIYLNESCPSTDVETDANSVEYKYNRVIDQQFEWSKSEQGAALGSYFYGYISTQIIGAWLSRKLGHVRVWGFFIMGASVVTIATPAFTKQWGIGGLIFARVLVGILSGVSYPVMHGMWGSWAPIQERSKLISIHFSGAPFGTFILWACSGVIIAASRWENIFYITGGCTCTWAIIWLFIMYDTPSTHPRISDDEREHIMALTTANEENKRPLFVPWKSILTSPAFLSTILPHFAANFGANILFTLLPLYLATYLNLNIKENTLFSSLPYVIRFLLTFMGGVFADLMISCGVGRNLVRKGITVIALIFSALAVVSAGYAGCNLPLILFFFVVVASGEAFMTSGYKAALVDIGPAYSGILFSLVNTVGMTSGILAPQIAGVLLTANAENPIVGWRSLFWIAATIHVLAAIVFGIFGSTKEQEWAKQNRRPVE